MDTNIKGFLLSYLFVFSVIGIARLSLALGVSSWTARKVVHIGVSNWWLIAMQYFTTWTYPAAGALSFIIINFLSYRYHFFKALEAPSRRDNLGTVYFPLTLLVLSLICFGGYAHPLIGAAGVLVMGYGDGTAALVGSRWGRYRYTIFGGTKTIEGSVAMFTVSFLVLAIVTILHGHPGAFYISLFVAAAATAVEALTPFGIDNCTVPLVTSALMYAFTG